MTPAILPRILILAAAAAMSLIPVAAFAADPPSTVVSRIADSRVVESSGLAFSVKHRDLAYTMNDSNNRGTVYAIQVSTGRVVGRVDLARFDLQDPESIAVDPQGRLWLADLGDNDEDRDDASILSFDEPGPGEAEPAGVQRFPVTFPDDPKNVEAMLVHPTTRQVLLINKVESGSATLYSLPQVLRAGQDNAATDLGRTMPANVADAAFTPDGRHALVKTATGVVGYDTTTWAPVTSFRVPGLVKGESITVEPGGRSILLGSEGTDSPLLRVTLPSMLAPVVAATDTDTGSTATGSESRRTALPPLSPELDPEPAETDHATLVTLVVIGGIGGAVAAVVVAKAVRRRRRLAVRHRRLAETRAPVSRPPDG